jgi:hypothetical protein
MSGTAAGTSGPTTVGLVTTTSNARQLSDGNAMNGGPGTSLGQAVNDKVGFFGATPVVQPGQNGLPQRTTANVTVWASTQSPSAVNPNTSGERSMTITGVLSTDMVAVVNKPTTQAGLLVGTARVSAASTVQVTFGNDTAATITPTATETYDVITLGAALVTTQTLTPAAVGPNTTSEQYFAVSSALAGQVVFVNKPTAQAGLIITNARVASAGQVAIQFQNLTAATITPTAGETYSFGLVAALSPAPIMTKITQTLTPAAVAANTTAEQTFTVAGLISGTEVYVTKPSVTANLVIAGVRVSAANTLAINFANNTAATITPPAEAYTIAYFTTSAPSAGSSTVLPAQRGSGEAALAQLGLMS